MTTDVFSKAEFEDALPVNKDTNEPLWTDLGFDRGEYTYFVRIDSDDHSRIGVLVRSSVKANGFSAAAGKDSIRLYLVNKETHKPLAKKVDAWTQRTHGWQRRMTKKICELYKKGLKMVNCPKCDGIMLRRDGKYGVFWGCSNYPNCRYTVKSEEELDNISRQRDAKPVERTKVISNASEQLRGMLLGAADEEFYVDTPRVIAKSAPIRLNPQQEEYVYAPIDENIRVIAGPGSGKTASTVERIVYLIEACNVNPEKVLYVTFTKAMATEGYNRIVARIPGIEDTGLSKQICTIHALCYRMLRWEDIILDVPKEWQIKKALNQFISGDSRAKIKGLWQHQPEKPGYKEVLYWISRAKMNGVTPDMDVAFLSRYLPAQDAEKVHAIRVKFDAWLKNNSYITFSDMIYTVEQLMLNDESFRNKYQAKFDHVLVDEAQDVNAQALRILITLSLEPGDNRIYERYSANSY